MKSVNKKKNKLVVLEKEGIKISPERYFFKYAFPCAQVKVKLGSLRPEEYDKLKEIFLRNSSPSRENLEKIFPPAFKRIKKLAERMCKNIWDFSVINRYWAKEHNIIIDQGDGMYGEASEDFKDLCKVHEAEIVKKEKDSLVVKYNGKQRIVSGFLVPDMNIGDKVRIHFAYAIEKLT